MTGPSTVDVTEQRESVAWDQLRASALVIVVITLLGGAVAWAVSVRQPAKWASTITLVTQVSGTTSDAETTVRTVQALVTSLTLAEDVAARTSQRSSRDIQNEIGVTRPPGSAVLDVTVTDSSRALSSSIARLIVPAIQTRLSDLSQLPQAARGGTNYAVYPFGQQLVTTRAVPVAAARNAGIAAVLSFLVALSVAIFRAQRRPVVVDSASAAAAFGSPVLATVPFLRAARTWNAVDAVGGMLSPGLATAWPADLARLLVVGPTNAVGADLVIMLGQTFAAHGRKVLLVDADLEHARLSRRLGLRKAPGLGQVLNGHEPDSVVRVLSDSEIPRGLYALSGKAADGLACVPAGSGDAAALAGSDVEEALARLGAGHEIVIISGPQVPGPVPATRLVEFANVTLLVAVEGRTTVADARATGQFVRALSTKPMGVIVLSRRSIDTLSVEIAAPRRGESFNGGSRPLPEGSAPAAASHTAAPGRDGWAS